MLHKCVARASCCPKQFYNQHNEGRRHLGVEAGKWRQRNLSKVKAKIAYRFPASLSVVWLRTGLGFPTLIPPSAFCSWVGFSCGLPSHFAPPFGEPAPSLLRGDGWKERLDVRRGSAASSLSSEPYQKQLPEPDASGGYRRNPQQAVMKWLTLGKIPFELLSIKGWLVASSTTFFFIIINIYYLNSRCSCYPDLFMLGLSHLS